MVCARLRLICTVKSQANFQQFKCLTLAVDVHFNRVGTIEGVFESFTEAKGVSANGLVKAEMSFLCNGAAGYEGFNWIPEYEGGFNERSASLMDLLLDLVRPATPQKIRLLYRARARSLKRLLRHLPGGDDTQLPSLSNADRNMYRT